MVDKRYTHWHVYGEVYDWCPACRYTNRKRKGTSNEIAEAWANVGKPEPLPCLREQGSLRQIKKS